MNNIKRLSQLLPDEKCRVLEVNSKPEIRRRLLDMGLIPGTRVTLQKIAPMGDPIQIHLRGYELTIRREDAGQIDLREVAE
jgi:Fe2+ transport system protein FeoA